LPALSKAKPTGPLKPVLAKTEPTPPGVNFTIVGALAFDT
jgi:hypothetical protein